MKLLLLSDSHGHTDRVLSVTDRHKDIACVVHLGDYARDIKAVNEVYPALITEAVKGNNDNSSEYPMEKIILFAGVKILITHGHTYNVGRELSSLISRAHRENARIAAFGHTHIPFVEEKDSIYLINPGCLLRPRSLRGPTYSILELTPSGFHANIFSY